MTKQQGCLNGEIGSDRVQKLPIYFATLWIIMKLFGHVENSSSPHITPHLECGDLTHESPLVRQVGAYGSQSCQRSEYTLEPQDANYRTQWWGLFYCYILFFVWYKNTQCCPVCIETWDVCVCTQVGDLCPSAWGVTKHGDWCPSPTGVKDVYDGVGIDSKRIYAYRWCSLLV